MDKLDKAIERIKTAEQMSKRYYNKPLMITYSGGKDSDVCVEIAKIAGIDFEVVNSHTSVDAPETVYHIRNKFYQLEQKNIRCHIKYPQYKGKRATMWNLIPQKMMPPTRLMRYCCDILKETSGKNRAIVTGVRWDESTQRKNTRGIYEDTNRNKDKRIMLINDNDDRRLLFERCEIQAKVVCNPIIDWTTYEVWDFLNYQKCETNPLYCKGYTRVGCIGCPLGSIKARYREFRDYPKYKDNYIRAFDRMIQARKDAGKDTKWENGVDVFRWWLNEDAKQIALFD